MAFGDGGKGVKNIMGEVEWTGPGPDPEEIYGPTTPWLRRKELESEGRWEELLAESADALERLAGEALMDFRHQQVDHVRIQIVEQKRLDVEAKLQKAIDTGERKANVTRYRNQLAKLPPVDQPMRDSLLELRHHRRRTIRRN